MNTQATRQQGSIAKGRRTNLVLACSVFAFGVSAFAQSGGGYVVTKSTIGSGGGTTTGAGYSLSGTVGQPDAATVSGAEYTVKGGFWTPVFPGVLEDPTEIAKTRFVTFALPGVSEETALRVKLVSLHHVSPPYTGGLSIPFTSFEGQTRWVGPPSPYLESTSNQTPFYAASLQCTPYYQDWSTVGLLHVTGSAIVPSSVYEVVNIAAVCQGIEQACTAVSAPLTVNTTRWGDVETPYNPPSATVQPDVADIGALVNKFRSAPGAPIKARALLAGVPGNQFGEITPEVLNVDFGFSHISACVDAFRGVPYPYTIQSCP